LAGLGDGAFSHGADGAALECGKQLIEPGLQATLEGAQQERDEGWKGEDPLPGKGAVVGAMSGHEGGIAQGLGDVLENNGMELAKSCSWFCPC
jgi:hypothetical protein